MALLYITWRRCWIQDEKKIVFWIAVYIYEYVVVNFLSQVIFVFLLFLGMVIYANEVETKEK